MAGKKFRRFTGKPVLLRAIIRPNKTAKTYRITGFTQGAAPLAIAEFATSLGFKPVKNLSIRRALAKRFGK